MRVLCAVCVLCVVRTWDVCAWDVRVVRCTVCGVCVCGSLSVLCVRVWCVCVVGCVCVCSGLYVCCVCVLCVLCGTRVGPMVGVK